MTVIELTKEIYIGDNASCFYDEKDEWAVIHACKDPCHKYSVGYKGNLLSNHPNYLIKEVGNHLYLNMVDMNTPLMAKFTDPIIKLALIFIKSSIDNKKKVLIHCNLGLSRSPSLALVYLAKISKIINNASYDLAKFDFIKLYPAYSPGLGIDSYLRRYWEELNL